MQGTLFSLAPVTVNEGRGNDAILVEQEGAILYDQIMLTVLDPEGSDLGVAACLCDVSTQTSGSHASAQASGMATPCHARYPMNPVVLDNVDASALVLTAVADNDMLLLNARVDGLGVAVLGILEVFDDVNTSVVAALVAEDGMLLLKAAADADVEVLVPPAVPVNAASATAEGPDGLGVAVLVILEEVDDVNTSVVAALVAEDDALLLEAAADADVEVPAPPAVLGNAVSATVEGPVLANAVSATVEGPGVLEFTALAVLDVDRDELLDPARAEVLLGSGVDCAMDPVVLDDVDTSALVLTAVADDVMPLLNACVDGLGRIPNGTIAYDKSV